jgi:hypothetical protein
VILILVFFRGLTVIHRRRPDLSAQIAQMGALLKGFWHIIYHHITGLALCAVHQTHYTVSA